MHLARNTKYIRLYPQWHALAARSKISTSENIQDSSCPWAATAYSTCNNVKIGPGSDKVHSKHECTLVEETGERQEQSGPCGDHSAGSWAGWLHHCPVMVVTPICGFPLWWDLQRGSRAVDGWWWWDWEASYACRAGRRFREGGEQARLAPFGIQWSWQRPHHGHQATLPIRLFTAKVPAHWEIVNGWR